MPRLKTNSKDVNESLELNFVSIDKNPNLADKTALAYFGPCSARVRLTKGGIHSIMDAEYVSH